MSVPRYQIGLRRFLKTRPTHDFEMRQTYIRAYRRAVALNENLLKILAPSKGTDRER